MLFNDARETICDTPSIVILFRDPTIKDPNPNRVVKYVLDIDDPKYNLDNFIRCKMPFTTIQLKNDFLNLSDPYATRDIPRAAPDTELLKKIKAIREALVNAICHRDYSRRGADIKFAIFDNRIEITSPGGLLPNVSIEDLGTGISELRNKVIGKILNESGLIEGYGTGVLRIRKYIQEKGLNQPEFKENNGFFKAIFFNSKVGKERKEGEVDRKGETELKNVDRGGEKLSENHIKTLKEKSYLRREGTPKGGYWKLLKNIEIDQLKSN